MGKTTRVAKAQSTPVASTTTAGKNERLYSIWGKGNGDLTCEEMPFKMGHVVMCGSVDKLDPPGKIGKGQSYNIASNKESRVLPRPS